MGVRVWRRKNKRKRRRRNVWMEKKKDWKNNIKNKKSKLRKAIDRFFRPLKNTIGLT